MDNSAVDLQDGQRLDGYAFDLTATVVPEPSSLIGPLSRAGRDWWER